MLQHPPSMRMAFMLTRASPIFEWAAFMILEKVGLDMRIFFAAVSCLSPSTSANLTASNSSIVRYTFSTSLKGLHFGLKHLSPGSHFTRLVFCGLNLSSVGYEHMFITIIADFPPGAISFCKKADSLLEIGFMLGTNGGGAGPLRTMILLFVGSLRPSRHFLMPSAFGQIRQLLFSYCFCLSRSITFKWAPFGHHSIAYSSVLPLTFSILDISLNRFNTGQPISSLFMCLQLSLSDKQIEILRRIRSFWTYDRQAYKFFASFG